MKKILSIIAVVVTAISVSYILKVNNEMSNNITIENREVNKTKEDKVVKNDANKDKKSSKIENKDSSNAGKSKRDKVLDKKSNEKITKDEKTKKNEMDKEKAENPNKECKTVFKVDKNTIVSSVSFEDKAKLLIYSRKLSTTDEAQIKELMKSTDELNSSIKIFKILKLRLDTKDYNSVKTILSPYIDVNLIEKNLK